MQCTRCRSGLRFDRGREVRLYAHLFEHNVEVDVPIEVLNLAVFHGPEVSARNVELGTIPFDHACGRIERSGESASARQLDSQRHSL